MRWDETKNGGFTTGEPWLPMGDARHRNVCSMEKDRRSILHLYRELISLRKQTPALRSGEYRPLRSRNDILSFERFTDSDRYHVALNLTDQPRRMHYLVEGQVMLSTHLDRKDFAVKDGLLLRPDEGVIIKCR